VQEQIEEAIAAGGHGQYGAVTLADTVTGQVLWAARGGSSCGVLSQGDPTSRQKTGRSNRRTKHHETPPAAFGAVAVQGRGVGTPRAGGSQTSNGGERHALAFDHRVRNGGVVLSSLVAAAPARAESKSQQMDQITSEEFLAMKPDDQQHIAYWVDGYQTAKGEAAVGVLCQQGLPLCHERFAMWPSRDYERYECARTAHSALASLWQT
jgi:HdeA/HdeB family